MPGTNGLTPNERWRVGFDGNDFVVAVPSGI